MNLKIARSVGLRFISGGLVFVDGLFAVPLEEGGEGDAGDGEEGAIFAREMETTLNGRGLVGTSRPCAVF